MDTPLWRALSGQEPPSLVSLLAKGDAISHPFVIGELACGSLSRRREKLAMLGRLPRAVLADHDEVLALVEDERLMALGIGWIDAHLLASSLLSDAGVWTRDQGLARAARKLGVLASER